MTTRGQSAQEQNKEVLRKLAESLNKGDLKAHEALYSPNLVYHGLGELANANRKTWMDFVTAMLKSFPGATLTVDDLMVEGDKVAYRMTVRGTQKGEFMGIPATNKSLTIRTMRIVRISGGKIVEEWENFDALGMLQQLGAIPAH
ncbi:MAG: ester cyclase [SAR202 cluster bacterium]|nr:ester cyclase [SAR202 cluster bacterium]